jgi:anti-anti-sigma regulatory factor
MKELKNDLGKENVVDHGLAVNRPDERVAYADGDLVVDLSGIKTLDLKSLALLLTAQQQAREEDREVWLAGVPTRIWQALGAMGLRGFFKPFPLSALGAV